MWSYTFIIAEEVQNACLTLKVIMWKKVSFKGIRISFPHLHYIINKLLHICSGKKVIKHL